MSDLRISYYEYRQPCKFDKDGKYIRGLKGIDYIRCKDGKVYEPSVWLRLAENQIKAKGQTELYEQIKDYVRRNFLFVKSNELREKSASILLNGTYKKWSDFYYQERISI